MNQRTGKLFALFLTVLLALNPLAGCGSASSGETAQGGGESQAPGQKMMVAAAPTAPINMDPYKSYGDNAYGHKQIYNALIYLEGQDRETKCDLAESYEVSEDGLTYTFTLRKGVKFHNGDEFDAEDAQFSVLMAPKSEFSRQYSSDIVGCDILDDYKIAIRLKAPNVSILERLSNIFMMNKEVYEKFGENYGVSAESVCGTGPYLLSQWIPGSECIFEANSDYFKGEPAIKNVKLKAMPDENTAVIALQTGEIHLYIGDIPGIAWDTIANDQNLNLVTYASSKLYDYIMNCKDGMFSDLRMRQAAAYAVDRQNAMNIGVEGHGYVADYPGYPNFKGRPDIENIWPYQVDLDKARELVKEAGYEGAPVSVKSYALEPYSKLATALQSELTSIGLNATVELMEKNTYIEEVLNNGNYEIGVIRHYPEAAMDMYEMMNMFLEEQIPGWNWTWYVSSVMEDILPKAAGEQDPQTRKDLYAVAIQDFVDNVPLIPLYAPVGNRAFTKDLTIDPGNVQYEMFNWYSWAE
ncbi:MAG: ABC transporter substrate-binding protein [Peptococcaceae bacterium]|nr:ABC transporter substrate-binding protein [Peptococcaceae bacterium]